MDKRWILVDIVPEETVTGVRYADAGTSAVNGDYYEDDPYAGNPTWTKVGGVYLEDSIHYEPTLSKFIITSGGTFAATTTNAKYDTPDALVENTAPFATWYVRDGSSTPPGGGTLPAPGTLTPVEDLSYVIPEEVTPLRVLDCKTPCKFVDEADLSIGLIAKRRKLTTDLHFRGDDYTFFFGYERWSHKRCEELTIRREWKCGNRWQTFWTGTFSTGAGSWDLGRCEFTVRPKVLDPYSCITDALNKKVNVLQVAPVTARAISIPSLEFGVCIVTANFPTSSGCDEFGSNEWDFAHTQNETHSCSGGGIYNLGVFWRERQSTECVAGSPVVPSGAGWVLLTDNCAVDGSAVYVRNSTVTWTFGDATRVDSASPIPIPPDSTCAWTYLGTIDVLVNLDPFCTDPNLYHHYFICLSSGDTTDFDRARLYRSAFEYALVKACPELDVVSDFFEWDPPGDAPGYVSGANYVTQLPNEHSAWALVQMSDAIDPLATNPATRGELTLKDFFVLMATGPKVFWRLDDLGRLRLEHWTYWTFPVDLDLTTADNVIEPLAYSHLSIDVPRIERPKWAAALNRDFAVSDIIYSGPCVTDNENDVKEYAAGPFVTDISFIISDPDAQSKEGFALLATAFNGTEYDTIIAPGALTTDTISNAPLSWANLERDFWTWDRFLTVGTMNGAETEFDGTQPTVEQKGVAVTLCCDLFDIDTTHSVRSGLQARLGTSPAYAQRVEIDDSTGRVYLTLRYAY